MEQDKPNADKEPASYRLLQGAVFGAAAVGAYIGYKFGTTILNPGESSSIIEAGLKYTGEAALTASSAVIGFATGLWVADGGLVELMEGE